MKIGILGGTFDPVHCGHLAIAKEAMTSLELSEVYFVPAARTPLKEGNNILSAADRVEMVRLAIAGRPYFKLSMVEIDRPGTSYTVDTISQLKNELGLQNELYFILGMDGLAQLPRWKDPARIVQMCRLVAFPRPGYRIPDLNSLDAVIPGLSQRLVILDKPLVDISATEIREKSLRGLPVDDLVPAPVAEYIKKHKLYSRG
jgi:nicotinate-nucleotide adenylyltransferase